MNKRYDEVMEKIEVTDAMRQRILANIDRMDPDNAPSSRMGPFSSARRLVPLAACFVLLVAGALSVRGLLPGQTVEPPPVGSVMVGSGIVEVEDAAALSEAVGFPIKEVTSLPFQADEVTYLSFWEEVAEITYTGEAGTVTFRQSVEEGDNSGDYTPYAKTETQEIGGRSVTLKGDGQVYVLAVWNDGTYAYSLHAEPGFTVPEWEAVIGDL